MRQQRLRALIEHVRRVLAEDDAHLFTNFPVGVPDGKETAYAEADKASGEQKIHIKGAPADVNRYYEECRSKQSNKSPEYCARVAWSRYCAYKNPDYKGCTRFGKKFGRKNSKPISNE